MLERGWPEATELETAEIQPGCAFSLVIPCSITPLPFSQTGGNIGPAWLSFPVREQICYRTRLERWQKNQAALGDLDGLEIYFIPAGSEETVSPKVLSLECQWGG